VRINKDFKLNKSQYELDFVNIDPNVDIPLFLDPYYISKCDFPFAIDAHSTLRSYFEFLLALLRGKRFKQAEELFSHLGETNDICLGMSRGKPRGHGMGPEDTAAIFKSLLESRAILSGVMEDIEDFRIFVPNIDKDKVSDMTANIIKKHLIEYTKEQCDLHCIPLISNVPSGMYWNSRTKTWDNQYTQRLIIGGKPILLVPKRIVSFTDKYTSAEYRQHFVLNYLQNENLRLQTSLVREYKSGEKYVTKKSIKEHESVIDKDYLARFTEQHPEVFADFKQKTSKKISSVEGAVIEHISVDEICTYLHEKLTSIPSGAANALLPCPFIFVECKNYTGKVANPELDQLSGRFSNRRGRVGILACRTLDEKEAFIKRCADTFEDDRGLIIPITDEDLIRSLLEFPKKGNAGLEEILASKYEKIVFTK